MQWQWPQYENNSINDVICRLQEDSDSADVTFVVPHKDLNEPVKILAHSLILRLRSDYFRELLSTNSEGTQPREITIDVPTVGAACAFINLVDCLYRDNYDEYCCHGEICNRFEPANTRAEDAEYGKHDPLYVHEQISLFALQYRMKGVHITIGKKIQRDTDNVVKPRFPSTLERIYTAVSEDALDEREVRTLIASIVLNYFHYFRKASEAPGIMMLPGIGEDLLEALNEGPDRLLCPGCGHVMHDPICAKFETIEEEKQLLDCYECGEENQRRKWKKAWRAERPYVVKKLRDAAEEWEN